MLHLFKSAKESCKNPTSLKSNIRLRQASFLSGVLLLFGSEAIVLAADPKVPANVIFEQGIEYSNPENQHLQLDLARPRQSSLLTPLVVCIHGGGFRAGSREGHDALCLRLAEHGYAAATVTYRLAPKYAFPAAVDDVKAAVRWLRSHATHYSIDGDKIASMGDSAGGLLALMLGVTGDVSAMEGPRNGDSTSSRVQCVVSYYGPSDLTQSYAKSADAAQVLPMFLGGNLETARDRHIWASPLNWVTPAAAPTLLLHGTEDKLVAYEQAIWMRDRLQACGVEVQLVTLDGAGHGFAGADAAKAEQAMLAFLGTHLGSSRSPDQGSIKEVKEDPNDVVVACVGDSITEGAGTSAGWNYPSQLARMLGKGWIVKNFGVSGTTMLKTGDSPYENTPAYQGALASKPRVVIIMLGTNDGKPQNWSHKKNYYSDYREMVEHFQALDTKPHVYVCHPCPAPDGGNWGINEEAVLEEIPQIDKIAKEKKTSIINMHEALAGHPEFLPDHVHPNNAGATIMAKTAYHALTGGEFEREVPAPVKE